LAHKYANQRERVFDSLKQLISQQFDAEYLREQGVLLDIGAGDGQLTERLAHHFKKVIAVEPDGQLVQQLSDLNVPNMEIVQDRFEDAPVQDQADLILAVQSLHYLEDGQLSKAAAMLKPGGQMVVVLSDYEGGKEGTYYHFRNEYLGIPYPFYGEANSQAQALTDKGYQFSKNIIPVEIETPDADEMLAILKFLAGRSYVEAEMPSLAAYRDKYLYDGVKNGYRINYPHVALVIKNTASSPIEAKKGGIDLDPALINIEIMRNSEGVPMPVPVFSFDPIQIDGLLPVIINITPAVNLQLLLGLADDGESSDVVPDISFNDFTEGPGFRGTSIAELALSKSLMRKASAKRAVPLRGQWSPIPFFGEKRKRFTSLC